MLVALFVGDHKADTWLVRLGWWLTRRAQKGAFKCVTHCEAILAGDASAATIASSSVRDGGVRIKHRVQMNPAHWRIVDVPQWSAASAAQWFAQHMSQPYDWRVALETLRARATTLLQARLEAFAQSRGYDSIMSACSYANDPDAHFSAEGFAALAARSATWKYASDAFTEIAGGGKVPTEEQFIAAAPHLTWETK